MTNSRPYSYIISILGFKLSVLFMFLRIAVDRNYRITIIMIAIACTCFHFCFLIVQINLCHPVSSYFDISGLYKLTYINLRWQSSGILLLLGDPAL